jgi:hypothetical protein
VRVRELQAGLGGDHKREDIMIRIQGICLLLVAGLISTASADSVTLNFDTAKPPTAGNGGGTINVTYKGSTANEYTGFYTFQVSADPNNTFPENTTSVDLFCFELAQYTDPWGLPNTDVVYDVVDPSVGPVGSPSPVASMGIARSNQIKSLYYQHFNSLTTSLNKKAFQMAIWEIVHEYNGGTTLDGQAGSYSLKSDGTGGDFFVNSDTGAGEARELAQSWLDNLAPNGVLAAVKAFTNGSKQDQLYWDGTSVPSPTALVNLAGLGLVMGWVAYWRRRRG